MADRASNIFTQMMITLERRYDTEFSHSDAEACTADVIFSHIGEQLDPKCHFSHSISVWNLLIQVKFFFLFSMKSKSTWSFTDRVETAEVCTAVQGGIFFIQALTNLVSTDDWGRRTGSHTKTFHQSEILLTGCSLSRDSENSWAHGWGWERGKVKKINYKIC